MKIQGNQNSPVEHKASVQIRRGNQDDLAQVLDLVHELAEYEQAADQVTTSLIDYQKAYDQGRFKILVAEETDVVVGMMLYYDTWSTWKGKMLYLEDFVIRQSHRRRGIGDLLMNRLLEIAREEDYRLIKWQVIDWNEPAVRFYEKIDGAVIDKTWWDVKVYF